MNERACQIERGETVLLLHGLFAGPWMMQPLANRLTRVGYTCINHGYPTVARSITELARPLAALLAQLDERDDITTLHAVTHSMGGIMLRQAAAYHMPRKLRRVVMLAPPNQGSHVARMVRPLLGKVVKPIADMSDRGDSLVNALPPLSGPQVGVIAASWDAVVPRASTHLRHEVAHLVLRASHVSIPFHRTTAAQVTAFLTQGTFTPTGSSG